MDKLQDTALLEQLLSIHILHRLPVQALAALACSSRALRDLLYAPSAQQAWATAAASCLPPDYPKLHQADRIDVQKLFERRWTAAGNLAKGTGIKLTVQTALDEYPMVCPCLQHICSRSAQLQEQEDRVIYELCTTALCQNA